MIDVTALGELLIDFSCIDTDKRGYPTMAAHPGGAPANFLAALAKFGASVAMLGKVGNDAFGHLLCDTLAKAGIDNSGVVMTDDAFTTLAFVTLDAAGERSFSFARKPGADTLLRETEVDFRLIDEARVFHYGTLSMTDEPARSATRAAVQYARSRGKLISFDPNYRPALWKTEDEAKKQMLWGLQHADVVKISDNEAEFLFGLPPLEAAERIRTQYGAKLVFVSCGAEGCLFHNAQCSGHLAAPTSLPVLDTTGAGDIFGGIAMYRLLQTGERPEELLEEQLREIVRFACTAASLSTTRPGGISSVPELAEVEQLLRQ